MTASTKMQDYLAEAYRIAHHQGSPYVSTSALADVLDVSAPAVTRMVQRLKDAGYIEHEPYQGILLTPTGEKEALMSIRRHRLVERFLVDVMKFGWHEVHDAADELGAVVSDILVNRMEKMSNYPKRCPHGEPIPSADGVMPKMNDIPLTEAEVGGEYVISRVNSHDGEKLKYLADLGIQPGVKFILLDRSPFEGPLHIRIDETIHFLGHGLVKSMRVCKEDEFVLA
ncbi:MAG: metal-dependent transcriptional regulator [Anaerolineae bacterium]|jgi:DtxR family Mn-dependent transcriptional regulator|nr:metal-dependent transcriptional regulator [Anaerolineae bacterium]